MHSSSMCTGRFSGRLLSAGVGGYVSALWEVSVHGVSAITETPWTQRQTPPSPCEQSD